MAIENLPDTDLREKLKSLGLGRFLDFLGAERFKQKKARMANLLKIANPDEALYREIMLALGYKNNKVQFLELALILPYSEIRALKDTERIEKALLYRAGFLQSKDGLPENFDGSLKMDRSVWQRRGTRPANFPDHRMKGIAPLLSESCETGLCKLIEAKIADNYVPTTNRRSAGSFCKELTKIFITDERKAVGQTRALEILFNIILPFFMAYFEQEGKREYGEFLQGIYDQHPTLAENSITRAMKSQLFGEDKEKAKQVVNSVRRYMGLIYLHNALLKRGEDNDHS